MKNLFLACFYLVLVFVSPAIAQTKRAINADAATIGFDFVTDDTSGTISELKLQIHYDPSDLSTASFSGTAAVNTLDTGNFLRDGHLMWEKFFDKKHYPTISFTSTKVIPITTASFTVHGNIIIKGIRKEISISFEQLDTKLVGKTTVYTSDFDIHIHEPRVQNQLDVIFNFPFQ